jgi:hypothetical protein
VPVAAGAAAEEDRTADLPAAAAGAAAHEERSAAPNGLEESSPEILAPGPAADAAVQASASAGRASDNGRGDVAEAGVPAARPAARRTPRRSRASRPAAGDEQPELPEPTALTEVEQDEAPAPNEPELAAAMVERRDSGPPRRGWWSRFVRKDE